MMQPYNKTYILCIAVLVLLLIFCACSATGRDAESLPVTTPAAEGEIATETLPALDGEPAGEETSEETSKETAEETQIKTSEAEDRITPVPEATQDTEAEQVTVAATEIVTTEEKVENIELTLATLNIKHGAEGMDRIAEAIRMVSPDIIGLEEVDVGCERSGYVDEPAELARLAGYSDHAFSKAISLGDGEYGTAILSRYPIESFEVIPLESGNGEGRSVGHAVICVEDLKLHVFVTHLSYQDRSLRITQLEEIAGLLTGLDHYAVLGDFNSFDLEDIYHLNGSYYVNRPDRYYITFPRFDLPIDNIVVSEGFTELLSDISDWECSDHRLLYAVFSLSRE